MTQPPGERGANINTHAVSLSVQEMKGLWLALSVAHLSRGTFEPATRQLWANLYERLKVVIQRCEELDRFRAGNTAVSGAGNLKPANLYFCISENCRAPVNEPGELCLDCGGTGGAA